MTMLAVKRSIVINCPLQETFAYVSDLERMPDWASAMLTVRKSSPGTTMPGTRVKCSTRFLGTKLDVSFVVVEYEPYRSFTLKSIAGATSCLFTYQFDPGEDGGTIVSQESLFTLIEGVMNVTEPVIASAIKRVLEFDLLTLKDMLETRRV